MKVRSIIALAIAIIFTFGVATMGLAAAEVKGTITKIDGKKVSIKDDKGKETTVEAKEVKDIKVGDKVTIKDGVVTKDAAKKEEPKKEESKKEEPKKEEPKKEGVKKDAPKKKKPEGC